VGAAVGAAGTVAATVGGMVAVGLGRDAVVAIVVGVTMGVPTIGEAGRVGVRVAVPATGDVVARGVPVPTGLVEGDGVIVPGVLVAVGVGG